MREILFRGKRVDNGEWIYGDVVQFPTHGIVRIVEQEPSYKDAEVDSETVGQYTGLTDKNGKKFFEGDIIKGNFSNYVIWADETERAFVYGKSYKGGYKNLMSDYLLKSSFPNGMEVVGNIHDNPELLEVTK